MRLEPRQLRRVSVRDWLPVGVDEYGYVAPDPLNPDIVYGGRTVTRFDRRSQVSGPVAGRGGGPGATGNFRQVRTMPVVFSEVDKRSLFFANNHLWKTWMAAHLETDQSRPDSEVVGHPEERGQVRRSQGHSPPSACDLHDRAIPGHSTNLGRHRRRPDSCDG